MVNPAKWAVLAVTAGVINFGTILSNPAPSAAQVTINVTGGNVSGNYYVGGIENPTGTLITPYGVYTGPFAAGNNFNVADTPPSFAWFTSADTNDFTGNAYVNGTLTPFTGNLNLTVDSAWPYSEDGNISKNITSGIITLNTPTSLTGFSFEASVTPPTPPVTPTTTPVTPTTTPTFFTVEIPELTATTFTIPEPLTEPGGTGQTALRSQGQQPQQFRPNGVHTRIIPTWTPGLYQ